MRAYFKIWTLALIFKMIVGALLPLANDESYYWVWGHNLQLSYFDHPPGVALLFWMGLPFEFLKDFGLPGAVRIPAIILGNCSFLLIRHFFKNRISEQSHVQILLVLICSPFFGLGSIVVTPDILHVSTWLLGLLAFDRYIARPSVSNAGLLGASLGLGFCAKYHMVIFFLLALGYLVSQRQWSALRPALLLTGLLSGLFFSLPVLIWNYQNEWASFQFQIGHGLERQALDYRTASSQVIQYWGAQLALLSPLVWFYVWRRRESSAFSLLHWFGWGPVLFFALTSARSVGEANWPIAGHLSLLAIAALNDRTGRVARSMIAVWSLASVALLVQGFNPDKPILGRDPEKLKTWEFVRFNDLLPIVKSPEPFFASSYQMAGDLSYRSGRAVPKLKGINRPDFFDFHPLGIPTTNTFTVVLENAWPWPDWLAKSGYRELSRQNVGRFTLVKFGRGP